MHDSKLLLSGEQRLATPIPETTPSKGLATVASAGAVWLQISSKVQAKKALLEGLSSLLYLCLEFSSNPKM